MNLAQPIRDQNLLSKIKDDLRKEPRSYILFLLGINTGLRISDLLSLKVKDVQNTTHIKIREQKTGKTKLFFINPSLSEEIKKYIFNLDSESFLFSSKNNPKLNISRFAAHKILKSVGNKFGLKNFSAHSMRKTFGFFYYQKTKDIALLQKIFNHSSASITLTYIGMSQLQMDQSLSQFYL
jgi:integrase